MSDDKPEVTGTDRICRKRHRQILVHGYTAAHDAAHAPGEFAVAAACLAEWAAIVLAGDDPVNQYGDDPHPFWPWGADDWSRSTSNGSGDDDPIEALANAGALIAAEIDATATREAT